MARYGGEDITEEMMQHFVRSMEMEREERGGQATLQYLKETGDIEAELGRVGEVAKTAKQKTVQVATEARGAADKKLLDWTIGLASLALMAYGGGALGLGGKGLKAFHALMKGSKAARYGTTIAGSLFAGGKAQKAGREVVQERAGEVPIAQYREPENGEAARDERLAARREAGAIETETRTLKSMLEQEYTPTAEGLGMEVGPESIAYARQLAYPIMALLGSMDFTKGLGGGGGEIRPDKIYDIFA